MILTMKLTGGPYQTLQFTDHTMACAASGYCRIHIGTDYCY